MDNTKKYELDDPASESYSGGAASVSTVSMPDYDNFGPNTGAFTINSSSLGDLNYDYDPDITVPEHADIRIGDRSLKTFMETMEKRMAILQPNPAKLEKFEALKKAYQHYKHLESLCDLEEHSDK